MTEASIVGGPIAMRGYDHLVMAQDHTAVLPDGRTISIPAGTRLVRHGDGAGALQPEGTAEKMASVDAPAVAAVLEEAKRLILGARD